MVRVAVESLLAQGALVGFMSSGNVLREMDLEKPTPCPTCLGTMFIPCFILQKEVRVSSICCLKQECSLEESVDVLVFAMKLNKSNDTQPMCTINFKKENSNVA